VAVVGRVVVEVVVVDVDARLEAGFTGTSSFLVPLEGLVVGVARSASGAVPSALLRLARTDVCGGVAGGVVIMTSAGGGAARATPAEGDVWLRVGERVARVGCVGVDTIVVGSCWSGLQARKAAAKEGCDGDGGGDGDSASELNGGAGGEVALCRRGLWGCGELQRVGR
jgi:hypothetical protein